MTIPSRQLVINWVSSAWESISAEIIIKYFLTCGISNTVDGSEDHNFDPRGDPERYRRFKFGDDRYRPHTYNAISRYLASFRFGDFPQTRQFAKLKTSPKFPAIG